MRDNNIDMTSIQSRPPKTAGDEKVINFNIDFHGNFEQENVQKAMDQLEAIAMGLT